MTLAEPVPSAWHTPVSHLGVGHSPLWAFQTLKALLCPLLSSASPPKQLLSILHTQSATPAVPPCCSLWKSQPNKFYTSIISGVINLPLETWLKCWRYWLGRVISFVFTGALVFFLLNKKCPKWSAFLHLYQELFVQAVQAPPACLEEPELHQISQTPAGRANINVSWHGLTNGTAATTPGTPGDLSPKNRNSTNTHLLLLCNISS